MGDIEEFQRDMDLKLDSLQIENIKLRQQLKEHVGSSFIDICYTYSSEGMALFRNEICEEANATFLSLHNSDIESVRKSTYSDFFCNELEFEVIKEFVNSQSEGSCECVFKGGMTNRHVRVTVKFPFEKDSGRFLMIVRDISEYKIREKQLQLEHDELNYIFNTSMIGIIYVDTNRVLKRANRRALEIVGCSPSQSHVGMSLAQFHVTKENFEEFGKSYKTILKDGRPVEGEYIFQKIDGNRIWLHYYGQSIPNPENPDKVTGMIWTFDDISQRKKAQEELENNNAELRAYFENSMMGIMIVNITESGERVVSRVNQRLVELVGYKSKDDMVGRCVDMFHVSKKESERFGALIVPNLLKGGIKNFEYQFKKKDGSTLWAAGSAQAIDTNIPPDLSKGIVFMYDDTTERKEDREKLERANAELAAYFDNSMVGVMILDENNVICRANKRLADIVGYKSPSELIGKLPGEFYYSLDEVKIDKEDFLKVRENNRVFQYEVNLRGRGGESIWVCASGKTIDSSVPPDFSKGVVWVVEDITSRKIAEKRLFELATIDELTQINNRRNFFAICNREFLIARRKKYQIGIFMIDIDHFKSINDTYGHDIGDKALKHFADICKLSLRPSDVLGRVGGEEFAVILPDTPKDRVVMIAERLRKAVMNSSKSTLDGTPPMTISIGVCYLKYYESLKAAFKRADKALYTAKNSGRNRVCIDE